MTDAFDFIYPTRWPTDASGNSMRDRLPVQTLLLSDVFSIVHASGNVFDAVLIRERSDRKFVWAVLARIPLSYPHEFVSRLSYSYWCACGNGYREVLVSHVDAGLDYPRHLWFRRVRMEMAETPSQFWNVWRAIMVGLRATGFTTEACPYRDRARQKLKRKRARR